MLTTTEKIQKIVALVAKAIGTTPDILLKPMGKGGVPPPPLTRAHLSDAKKILIRILRDDVGVDMKRLAQELGWRHCGGNGVYYYYDLAKIPPLEMAYQAVRKPALRVLEDSRFQNAQAHRRRAQNAMNTTETQSRRSVQRLVRRIPVDFRAIAAETGMTRGKLCRSTWAGWVVQNTTGNPEWPDMATVTPPATEAGETLTVENNHWCVYAPNNKDQ